MTPFSCPPFSCPRFQNERMIRYLFTAASVLSLVLCLRCAHVALFDYVIWAHGYMTMTSGTPRAVVHDQSYFEASRYYAVLAILSTILPLVWLALCVRRAIRRTIEQERQSMGRCAGCGYDLRANTGRCPECGTPITATP